MRARILSTVALSLALAGCVERSADLTGSSSFRVELKSIDGKTSLPTEAAPLPVDLDRGTELLELDITARRPDGSVDETFQGFARISLHPGTVVGIESPGAVGRNVLLVNGQALGQKVRVTAAHGPTRVWVEDLGDVPAAVNKTPACANGIDDNQNGLIDYPSDPGCAFANDDSEDGGSYATGLSAPIYYALPRIADARGLGAATPYSEEQLDLMASAPANLVVTRIAPDGFYVSDITETRGYGGIFAFNFSSPVGLRVCDRITSLSGTPSDFYGFTELGFPSWTTEWWDSSQGPCPVPEPVVLQPGHLSSQELFTVESSVVRVQNLTVAKFFGPGNVTNAVCLSTAPTSGSGSTFPASGCTFDPGATNCDLNGDGKIDFTTKNGPEANCANNCAASPQCSEWLEYATRHNFRVQVGAADTILMNLDSSAGVDAALLRGLPLVAVTGTLRYFSGGTLNWTVETRCTEDLTYCPVDPITRQQDASCLASPPVPQSSAQACVRERTIDDPGTN